MISPHPDMTQQVAEAARRERLTHLAAVQRYPGPASIVWARFKAGPVVCWFELLIRRAATAVTPTRRTAPVREPSGASPSDG